MSVSELPAAALRLRCRDLDCGTSAELEPLEGIMGQERALKALSFGLGIDRKGFNIYVAGQPGTGKSTAVERFVTKTAKTRKAPSDWCYVNDFSNPYEPLCLELPTGRAEIFRKDVHTFVEEIKRTVPRTLQSDQFQSKRDQLIKTAEEKRNDILSGLGKEAEAPYNYGRQTGF